MPLIHNHNCEQLPRKILSTEPTHYNLPAEKFQLKTGRSRPIIVLITCGLGSTVGYLWILAQGDLRWRVPEFLLGFFLLTILYLISGYVTLRFERHLGLNVILSFAVLFRLILLFSPPSLSDDLFRYVWEGRLQTCGVNPYQFPPEAPELVPSRDEIWRLVNNKNASAIHPPLIQFSNFLVSSLSGSIGGFKLAALFFDGMVIYLVLKILNLRQEDAARIILYAWNPLIVVEIAGSGHHDALVAGLVLLAAWFSLTRRELPAVMALGGSILAKIYPLMLIPFFLRRIRWSFRNAYGRLGCGNCQLGVFTRSPRKGTKRTGMMSC